MDEIGEDSRYSRKPYPSSSANRSKKFPYHSPPAVFHHRRGYLVGDHNGVGGDEYGDDDRPHHPQFDDTDSDSDQDELDDDVDEDGRYNPRLRAGSGGGGGGGSGFPVGNSYERYPKRHKKVRSAVTNYEFAPRPRIPAPLPVVAQVPGPIGRRHAAAGAALEWNEHEKFVLLEVWGDKFLQLGRKSLRSEDWGEVAEKVTEAVKAERTVEQCRGMMDVLKRKYRKEKAKGGNSKWGYFRKMDMLFGEAGGANVAGGGGAGVSLGCGVDSGEFVFMDTRVYLDRSNGNDEMRDSPCGSEWEEEGDDDDGFGNCIGADGGKGLRVLADSVMRFGEIYEKIESSKKDQMVELERMRVEFQKELELQKKLILERAQDEIAKIRQGDGEGECDDDDEGSDMDDDNNGGGGGDVYDNGDGSRENAKE